LRGRHWSGKRKFAFALMIFALVLLNACGGEQAAETEENIQAYYSQADTVEAEAEVVADFEDIVSTFRLSYVYDATAGQSVTVLEPESIRGIKATVSGDGGELEYEGVILATGPQSSTALSPIGVLPALRHAWSTGYVENSWTETLEETECAVLDIQCFDSAPDAVFRTWFDKDSLQPVYAEVIADNTVVLQCTFYKFSAGIKNAEE